MGDGRPAELAGEEPIRPPFHPSGLWTRTDFLVNKHFWEKRGVDTAAEIRRRNLIDIRTRLQEAGIRNFLIGKTLRGLVRTGAFESDNDDDFGIEARDRTRLVELVAPRLLADGFSLIRTNEEMVSFERDFRYVDICLFRKGDGDGEAGFGYANKWHDASHFEMLESRRFLGESFDIPSNAEVLLVKAYESGGNSRSGTRRRPSDSGGGPDRRGGRGDGRGGKRARRSDQGNEDGIAGGFRVVSALKRRLRRSAREIRRLPLRMAKSLEWAHGVLPPAFCNLLDRILASFGEEHSVLSEEEFRGILIEPEDSYNWAWRKRHLDPVTDSGRCKTVGAILTYLSDVRVREDIERNLSETDTSIRVLDPINRDMDFWWGGNNYFWNCVKYGFRKGVVPYSDARHYIESGRRPLLYTGAYYEGLAAMGEREIRRLLSRHPIEITDGAVTSGKHRAFAMIGRMLAGEGYLPMRARLRVAKQRRGGAAR